MRCLSYKQKIYPDFQSKYTMSPSLCIYILCTLVQVEKSEEGKFTVAMMSEKLVPFNADTNEMPSRGPLSEAVTDLIVRYLVSYACLVTYSNFR